MLNAMVTMYVPVKKGGVTDYAEKLRLGLGVDYCAIKSLSKLTSLSSDNLFLNYSGYGYAERGAPLWMIRWLAESRLEKKVLGIFFHELYAVGPPWKSEFWLSPLQRHTARRLAEMSDFWITNREGSAQWLRLVAGDKPHVVLPVFSNVGEMPAYIFQRSPKIVVFGSAGLRAATYRAAGPHLLSWVREQGLVLHDIGSPIEDLKICALLRDAGVVQHGRIDLEEVSMHLSDARFGILAYPADYVAKSGVFAAYCAHGVCPILISKHYASSDGLMAGIHYFAGLPLGAIQHSMVRNIGSAAWNWYQPHRIKAHVSTLKQLLNEAGAAC